MADVKRETADEEWAELKDSLSQWKSQKLKIDGYDISLRLEKVSMLELVIAVYVNGEIRGAWGLRKTDEAKEICRRFFWQRSRYKYSKDTRDMFVELDGKRKAKKDGMFDRVDYWSPYFKSFETLKRTFQDNNDHIEWIND